ncbi:VOC family protein [Marivirga lumbricoides]|uniref:VOC family protein n=1 Tax=Marivirga lumbricoides TaxID=1046115 RepID=A0A2T4DQW8_9BACT|nr:VOC family protein [Marivirga lumbricoides]GGC47334.1 VOC family protein [Marivirga lumbricoides]
MKKATQPYFHFDGNCREAMTFYQNLFGGKLDLMPIKDSPAKDQFQPEIHDQIMHASLENGDFMLMASDMCGMGEVKRGNNVEINLNCESEEEINHLYQQLSAGGEILNELREEFWGAKFAMLIDQFGVRWMMNYEK